MTTKFTRPLLAFLLLPLVVAACWSFFDLLLRLGKSVSDASVPFWLGLAGYFLFQAIFFRPIRTYVFGHELTHALVGILSGARLKSFKVTAHGGSVSLTKSNEWIALAPYFVPLYTLFIIAGYRLAGHFWSLEAYYPVFLFAAGFSLSFHIGLTHFALAQGQSDLKKFGTFYSGVIIALISCLIMTGILKLLFPQHVGIRDFFTDSAHRIAEMSTFIYHKGCTLWASFRSTR